MDDGESGLEVGVGAVPHMVAVVMRGDVVGVVTTDLVAGVADMKHSMDDDVIMRLAPSFVLSMPAAPSLQQPPSPTAEVRQRRRRWRRRRRRASPRRSHSVAPQHGLNMVQLEPLWIKEQKVKGVPAMSMSRAAHLGGGGGPGHLLSMHPPTLSLSLSALPRPGADAGVQCTRGCSGTRRRTP